MTPAGPKFHSSTQNQGCTGTSISGFGRNRNQPELTKKSGRKFRPEPELSYLGHIW